MTCREAIEEIFQNEAGVLSTKDVIHRIYEKYPSKPWKESTISAHLIALSVNHPSGPHYPSTHKHAFLFWLQNGRYRKWDKMKDGIADVGVTVPVKSMRSKKAGSSRISHERVGTIRDKTLMEKVFGIVSFLDDARWKIQKNYNLINYHDSQITNDAKLLTHWLCYVTDRQMGFERIWDVGGFIFSELVDEVKKKRTLDLLDPDNPGSFFIQRKGYAHKAAFFDAADDEKYLFVSHQTVNNNHILLEYDFTENMTPFFVSRYYPSDYFSILFTLSVLKSYGLSFTAYIKRLLDIIGHDESLISKLLFGMYLLTYEGIGQPKHSDIAFKKNMASAGARANKIESILGEKAFFEREFQSFRDGAIFSQKRAWCSLRDFLKSPEFSPLFFASLQEQGYKQVNSLRSPELLKQLELPGDVWNNRPKFRNCVLKGTSYEGRKDAFPRLLREIYKENDILMGYPEQFDVSFDLVPRMCERGNCDICVIGKIKGRGADFEKTCVRDTNKFCPVALLTCNYKKTCDGADCKLLEIVNVPHVEHGDA